MNFTSEMRSTECGFFLGSVAAHGLLDKFSRIKQMLRPEVLGGPFATFLKLDSEKVAGIAESAITNGSHQLSVAVTHGDRGTGSQRILNLEADAAEGDIFQIRHSPPLPPRIVVPNHFHELRAQQPGVGSPFLHSCLIGEQRRLVSIRLALAPQAPISTRPTTAETRLGIVIRVAFFVATVLAGLLFLSPLLLGAFGLVVAATVGISATGLAANLLTMRIFDRRPLTDIGLAGGGGSGRNFLIGLVFGALAAALMLLAPLLAGTGHLVARPDSAFNWASLLFYLAALLLAAAGEEMIFRGYAFQLLVEKIGPFATVLPVGVIFGLAHSWNPNATLLGVLNTILWGILLGYAFLRSHDLWLPIGLHYGWNAVLPLFGVNLSGLTIEVTRYFYRWDLRPLWSGGSYGPEGGLLATVFVIALFFALARAPVLAQWAAVARTLNEPI